MKSSLIYGAMAVPPLYLVAAYLAEIVLELAPSNMFFAGAITGAVLCGILNLLDK